jgi:hypothetical protein
MVMCSIDAFDTKLDTSDDIWRNVQKGVAMQSLARAPPGAEESICGSFGQFSPFSSLRRANSMFKKSLVLMVAFFVVSLTAAAALADTKEGTIKSVNGQAMQLVVTVDGEDKTVAVAEDAKITLDGEAVKLAELRPGQTATITCEKDGDTEIATSIEAKTAL